METLCSKKPRTEQLKKTFLIEVLCCVIGLLYQLLWPVVVVVVEHKHVTLDYVDNTAVALSGKNVRVEIYLKNVRRYISKHSNYELVNAKCRVVRRYFYNIAQRLCIKKTLS